MISLKYGKRTIKLRMHNLLTSHPLPSRSKNLSTMKKTTFILALVAGLVAFTGCGEDPVACEEGNKATLTVYNYTACTDN